MSKITVKHFLNKNLKPYIISGDNYYSVYVLVTANRQNTKFKSCVLNEYYNENDFNDLINSNDPNDAIMIKNEVNTISIISELVIDYFKNFDTTLLSAFFNFSPNIFIWNTNTEFTFKKDTKVFNSWDKNLNKMGIALDTIFLEYTDEIQISGVSVYDFFNYENQEKLKEILLSKGCKTNIAETIYDINKIVFIGTFAKFSWYLLGSKKNKELVNKYSNVFENAQDPTFLLSEDFLLKYSI